ncbi:histidine phosphotransferase [Rhodobacter sp. Har01]|uniref:histidine phosphotransferase family protein n=1 Tax=Rhodobacter sp. Har01 TaxID=2883999 RepID=UPI001D095B9B|nr:histidine phosphotransferase family protein [Rhodobacter sp. Har01]MCB6176749.1 histidine phosphotransferase [Rhodobacter sp. Har01]
MQDKPDLAALIGSRICHDLISPIGAIGNGVELLMMDRSAAASPELALIAESVANANARIRYFRVAFGSAAGDQRIARGEVVSILNDMTRGGRLTVDWQSPSELSRREVKLAFLLLQCLESAMAYGGKVRIERGDTGWLMQAEAARLKIDPALWEILTERHPPAEIGAAQVHFALVPEELHSQSRRLVAELKETAIRLSF